MNKQQKQVLQSQLNNEEQTIKELKQVYQQALKDCDEKIRLLSARADMNPDNLQSIIYQKNYQEALKGQLEGVLENLHSNSYATISDYLTRCYQDGYIGVMYDLQGQSIPLIMPIDQEAVTKAIQIDSKISKGLYSRLGEDTNYLKKAIRAEISRGIANGSTWNQVASKLSKHMENTPFNKAYNNSIRIARTEGHRVQTQSALDAQHKAKKKGADIVKQWDASLDGRTRPTHRQLDGQIREIDEPFEVAGMKADAPGMFGDPAEDCNCRCALLQRAKWALDEAELETLKQRAEYYGLDKSKDFEDYKEKYLKIPKEEIVYNRDIPEIKFDIHVEGIGETINPITIKNLGVGDFGNEQYELIFSKREQTKWDDIPIAERARLKYTNLGDKTFYINKGSYNITQYVKDSPEYIKRQEIAESIQSKYLGSYWDKKNGVTYNIDFYEKNGKVLYSVGEATMNKTLDEKSFKSLKSIISDREKTILGKLEEKGISTDTLTYRKGDEWVESMKEFHRIIDADGLPSFVSDSEYEAIKSPVLYRGIAPQSKLRKDITTDLSTVEMADEFFKNSSPFPSRGVYGDGVAYCSPSYKKIALNYATNGGTQMHGGVIIEFKLKSDSKIIEYEDAVSIFKKMSKESGSKLLFNPNQKNAIDKEVGKAMNSLGYDAILKHNGDNTGKDFYVILNRGSLVAKNKYITKKL